MVIKNLLPRFGVLLLSFSGRDFSVFTSSKDEKYNDDAVKDGSEDKRQSYVHSSYVNV